MIYLLNDELVGLCLVIKVSGCGLVASLLLLPDDEVRPLSKVDRYCGLQEGSSQLVCSGEGVSEIKEWIVSWSTPLEMSEWISLLVSYDGWVGGDKDLK